MASGLITLWQIDGETMETVMEFLFLGSKITVDSDSSHEIRRCLPLGRKAVANLDSILKSKDITLLTKACIVKAMVFPVVMLLTWEMNHKESRRLMLFFFFGCLLPCPPPESVTAWGRGRSYKIRSQDIWKTDAFELWCWRKFLRVPWTARRSNQSILKEISLEYL